MSTISKTKPIDKKAMNDSYKTSGSMVTTTGAYHPLLGTYQTVESVSASLHSNNRLRNTDESDNSTGPDFDSASNNGSSWSGDSEDHKEKPQTTKQETIPGADNDKREKTRLKNERKHQRQREKKAQELHERCCHYLMSRKLEVLAQNLIAMGIAHERATYALMLNQGKLEESINWLFDDGGANLADTKKLDPTSRNLKLDITQELSRISELEAKYKCTKQDVEKAVVTSEGDIEKAEESLRRQKQEQALASSKAEDVNSKVSSVHTTRQNTIGQFQTNSGTCPVGSQGTSYVSGEPGNQRSLNSLDRIHMKLQWMKLQQNSALEEKKRVQYQQTQLLLQRPSEETQYDQFNTLQQQELREPGMMMHQHQLQRSQSAKTSVLPVSTSAGSGWYPANRSEAAQSTNGYLPTRTLTPNDVNSNLWNQQLQYQQYQGQVNHGHRTAVGSAPVAVAPAASLGLFSGYGSVPPASGSSSGLDWNMDRSMGQLDYNNIDWSVDKGQACPRPSQQQQYVAASSYEAVNMNERTKMMANGTRRVQDAAFVGNVREWTSPFEGRDLFSLSRQFVPPSL